MTTMIHDGQRRRGDALAPGCLVPGQRVWPRRRSGVLLAGVVAGAAVAGPAQAADFVVTTLDDGGPGSLRQAIEDANANGAADTITFDEDLAGDTILLSGELTIANDTADPDLSIDGDLDDDGVPDITVDAQGGLGGRVFEIASDANATLEGLVITGGIVAGIENFGTLTVEGSTISGNNASTGGVGSIFNGGTLTVEGSTISGNNSAGVGGGIRNDGTATVANSTISGNSAEVGAGGIFNNGTLTVTNSTISGNSTNGPSGGGGIRNLGALTVTNSTISDNSGGDGDGDDAGGIFNSGTLQIKSTIVAGNRPADCRTPGGSVISDGFNLDGDGSCELVQPTDLPDTDPMLGELMDNSGPTETMALLEGSPAIDHIPLEDCTDIEGMQVETDQRGVARPQPFPDGNCDIGAFELIQEAPFTIADVIELFDQAVEDGTLMGAGPVNVAPGRLRSMRNMLLAAGDLLAQGHVNGACGRLLRAGERTDGAGTPPDFVKGEAAPELFDSITGVQDELGCFA